MKKLIKKDQKRRHLIFSQFFSRLIWKTILLVPTFHFYSVRKWISRYWQNFVSANFANICFLTKRARLTSRLLGFSRHGVKRYINMGNIYLYRKY